MTGETRSGKSTVGLSLCSYISRMTGVPFTIEKNMCANESETLTRFPSEQEYYKRVQDAEFNEVYQIDEQKETTIVAYC